MTTSFPAGAAVTSSRSAQDKFYIGLDDSEAEYRRLVAEFAPGDRVAEIDCRADGAGFELAARGVEVVEVPPSAAGDLDVADRSVDGVIGSAVLHDIDIARAFAEMARVLKPEGRAVFIEPLGHNPLINAYRRLTPKSRDTYAHPMRREDFSLAARWFRDVDVTTHHLLSMLAAPIAGRPTGRRLQTALSHFDRTLVDRAPGLRWQAWIAVLELRGPV